jgi:hypothetical protein
LEENKKKNLPTFSSLEEGRRETNEKKVSPSSFCFPSGTKGKREEKVVCFPSFRPRRGEKTLFFYQRRTKKSPKGSFFLLFVSLREKVPFGEANSPSGTKKKRRGFFPKGNKTLKKNNLILKTLSF